MQEIRNRVKQMEDTERKQLTSLDGKRRGGNIRYDSSRI